MKLYFPNYYHSFHCIASNCPDSCCHEWTVDVDPETAEKYRALPGNLGDRLRSVLQDTGDGTVMTIVNGRCPMWRDDGLCRIHAELGHDALCKTCRDFPRLTHDYGDFTELGLELSCPEAARLILTTPYRPMLFQAIPGDTEPDYDPNDMALLLHSRREALTFMQATKNVPYALAALLLYAHDVQAAMDSGEVLSSTLESCIEEIAHYRGQGDISAVFDFFRGLEILTPQWKQRLDAPSSMPNWNPNLACYFIERYWLQAISDFDLLCRVKFVVSACLLIGYLGGNIIETAQLFSKEIENDPDNMEAIFDGAYTSPALTDTNLLALLTKECCDEN